MSSPPSGPMVTQESTVPDTNFMLDQLGVRQELEHADVGITTDGELGRCASECGRKSRRGCTGSRPLPGSGFAFVPHPIHVRVVDDHTAVRQRSGIGNAVIVAVDFAGIGDAIAIQSGSHRSRSHSRAPSARSHVSRTPLRSQSLCYEALLVHHRVDSNPSKQSCQHGVGSSRDMADVRIGSPSMHRAILTK